MPSAVNSKDIEELINNLKSGIGLWEDLILKSSKFSNSIKGMTMACSDLLDSMHTVCDLASKSNCGLRNTGISLTKLVLREKKIEMKVSNISNTLSENLVGELEKYVNEWRKSSNVMKKEREHEWRRASAEYQKSLGEVERTEKKLRKKNAGKVGLSETASLQIEYANQDAQNKRRYVEELERCALRRAAIEERQRFKQFLFLLKPILDYQLSIREDLDNLEEVVSQLYGEKAENLDILPEYLEQTIQEHMIDSNNKPSISRNFSTLSKQQGSVSNGSKTSLNSNSMSTTSSEWNNNNVLVNTCMEVSSRTNENFSSISCDSSIKSDKIYAVPYDGYQWNKTSTPTSTLEETKCLDAKPESDSEDSSTEDENDASTDHNSQDGIIENNNDVFPLPDRRSNGESQFELPPDYPDSLPPPPLPPAPSIHQLNVTNDTITVSQYSQPFTSQRNALYPNQSIPSPVYSNLPELKIYAEKKFGASTLSRLQFKERTPIDISDYMRDNSQKSQEERSMSFSSGYSTVVVTTSEIERPLQMGNSWSIADTKEMEVANISPPPLYCNSVEEKISCYGNLTEQDSNQSNQSRPPIKTDIPVKSSSIRRTSFATEMQVPQTPKAISAIRRPTVHDKIPSNTYSNKVRGRSSSVSRESNVETEDLESTSEDFNTIRSRLLGQRIVSRINSELKPPTLIKSDIQKKQPSNTNYISYDYSHNLSSPVAIRSNRFYNERISKTLQQPMTLQASQLKYHQQRASGSLNHDMESAAGEQPATDDFDAPNLGSMSVSRKEDRFKQQLMQVLHAPKSQDGNTSSQSEFTQPQQSMSSFYNQSMSSNSSGNRTNTVYGKPKNKSSIPNSKYTY